MAKGRESFDRRQRERAKKAKADAKRERRHSRGDDEDVAGDEEDETPQDQPAVDQEAVMAALAKLHAAYDDGNVDFDAFEEQRAELLSRLQVD